MNLNLNPDLDQQMNELADRAVTMAARGAFAWMREHGYDARAYINELTAALRTSVKAALPAALDDMKKALESRMDDAAELTFALSMGLAGVEAARTAVGAR